MWLVCRAVRVLGPVVPMGVGGGGDTLKHQRLPVRLFGPPVNHMTASRLPASRCVSRKKCIPDRQTQLDCSLFVSYFSTGTNCSSFFFKQSMDIWLFI